MMHKSIEAGQKKASAQSAQSARSDEPMHRGDKSSSEEHKTFDKEASRWVS